MNKWALRFYIPKRIRSARPADVASFHPDLIKPPLINTSTIMGFCAIFILTISWLAIGNAPNPEYAKTSKRYIWIDYHFPFRVFSHLTSFYMGNPRRKSTLENVNIFRWLARSGSLYVLVFSSTHASWQRQFFLIPKEWAAKKRRAKRLDYGLLHFRFVRFRVYISRGTITWVLRSRYDGRRKLNKMPNAYNFPRNFRKQTHPTSIWL